MKHVICLLLVCCGFYSMTAQKSVKHKQAIQVLEKSMNYLAFENSWNNEDDRICEDDSAQRSYSLYCALHQSQLDITGKYKHRGLVMKTIRKVVKGKVYQRYPHIIRDYNNLESTTLDDIKTVIKEAMKLISSK